MLQVNSASGTEGRKGMNHLVIDLEMCKVPRNYRGTRYKYGYEVIQIGAVLMDEEFREIDTLSQFVHPIHGVIDRFISSLTGIQQRQVKKAPELEAALLRLLDWLGDREYKVYAWSETDYQQLQHEMEQKQIEEDRIADFMNPSRWIDYQRVFGERYHFTHSVGLEEALVLAKIEAEGRFHDGLCDASNTGRLIAVLEQNPDYELHDYSKELEEGKEPLSFGLGSLFAGLNLDLDM